MAVDHHHSLPPQLSNSNFHHSGPAADIPPRISSTHGLHDKSKGDNPTIPRRKSSKRPMSQSSGDWFASGKAKPGMATITNTVAGSASSPLSSPASGKEKEREKAHMSPHSSPKHRHSRQLMPSSVSSQRPPDPPPKGFGDELIYGRQSMWSEEKERILLGPFDYMYGQPGKDIRAQLIAAFNVWLKVPEQSLAVITKVVGMLHTASLLVDDVEDYSLLRRGVPVAHSIFGTPQTLNSANYAYFLALQSLSTLQNPACLRIYTEELLNLHRGQGMDLYWRDSLTCPSEADYLEMVSNKTGGLFRLAIKLMQAEASVSAAHTSSEGSGKDGHTAAPVDCVPLVNTIGLYFQILDDLLNLQSSTYTERKGLCEDLTEGKFSFPVIHAIRTESHAASTTSPSPTTATTSKESKPPVPSGRSLEGTKVIANILRMKTRDDEVKRYAVSYMERLGSFEYTRSVLRVLEEKAVQLIEGVEQRVGGEEGRVGGEKIRGILGKLKAL